MTIIVLVIAIPMAIGAIAWWSLLFWGARKDGEFQRRHDVALKR